MCKQQPYSMFYFVRLTYYNNLQKTCSSLYWSGIASLTSLEYVDIRATASGRPRKGDKSPILSVVE